MCICAGGDSHIGEEKWVSGWGGYCGVGKQKEGRTTARMKELPAWSVEVPAGAELVEVGVLPPLVLPGALVGTLEAAPGRH